MRSEENPLDLNNLPDDYSKDGKQVLEDTSSYSASYRKKKSGGNKEDKDESGKVYECRFCSLKFCKSQALGGHMNRHRQERETETLNRARQLVFTNDNILGQAAAHHLSNGQQFPNGGYQPTSNINGDPNMPFRTIYTPRMYSDSSPTSLHPIPPPLPPPYMYPSPPRLIPYPSQYPVVNDYIIGHALPHGTTPPSMGGAITTHHENNNNHTCIGAPFGPAFPHPNGRSSSDGSSNNGSGMPLYNHDQELSWARNCMTGSQHRF